jgi:hypothetical protein
MDRKRTWTGRTRLGVAVLLGATLVLCTGAAGASGASFREELEAHCIEGSGAVTEYERENGIPLEPAEQVAALEARLPGRVAAFEELEQLKPPKKLKASFEEFLDARRERLDVDQQFVDASAAGDEAAVADLRTRQGELDDQENAAARDMGLYACAERLRPREEKKVRKTLEETWTTADPAYCTERYTEVYVTSFIGSVEECEAGETDANTADSLDIEAIEGVGKSRVNVDFVPEGGPDDGVRLREVLVYEDGIYKRQASYSLDPQA